jgi:hypothetical protein
MVSSLYKAQLMYLETLRIHGRRFAIKTAAILLSVVHDTRVKSSVIPVWHKDLIVKRPSNGQRLLANILELSDLQCGRRPGAV